MKKYLYYYSFSSILILMFACAPASQLLRNEPPALTPLRIVKVDSHYIGPKYGFANSSTWVYPGRRRKKIVGYLYDTRFTVVFEDESGYWDRPFYLQLEHPDGRIESLEFNSEWNVLAGNTMYDFYFVAEVKHENDELLMTIGYEMSDGEILFETDNPFKSRSFVLR